MEVTEIVDALVAVSASLLLISLAGLMVDTTIYTFQLVRSMFRR